MQFDVVVFRIDGFFIHLKLQISYFWGLECFKIKFIDFQGILNESVFEILRDFGFLNDQIKKERFSQQFFGLKLDLVIHFFAQIDFACLISGH